MDELQDNSPMPWGKKFRGIKMANVPAWYLISMYDMGILSVQVENYVRKRITDLREEVLEQQNR